MMSKDTTRKSGNAREQFTRNILFCSIKPNGENMKKAIITVFLIGFACFAVNAGGRAEKGNGNVISSERAIPPFEKIENAAEAIVRFHASREYRAIVTVDSNLDKYVKTTTRNNVLRIETEPNVFGFRFTRFVVDIYCPMITGVSISGSGRFEAVDKITAPAVGLTVSGSGAIYGDMECDAVSINISGSGETEGNIKSGRVSANISGSGNMKGNINCDIFSVRISGSGKMTINGNAGESDINISGSGDIFGSAFMTNNANIGISGSGNVNIWAVDYIKANISGSGGITYRGNPKIDFSGSGSGRIRSE
jgi:hypothetical protein